MRCFASSPSPADRNWYQQLIAAGELPLVGRTNCSSSLLSRRNVCTGMTRFFTCLQKEREMSPAISRCSALKTVERISTRKDRDGGRKINCHLAPVPVNLTPWVMLFLSKALILHDSPKQCRIVCGDGPITDLEEQLSAANTFASGGAPRGKTKPMQ